MSARIAPSVAEEQSGLTGEVVEMPAAEGTTADCETAAAAIGNKDRADKRQDGDVRPDEGEDEEEQLIVNGLLQSAEGVGDAERDQDEDDDDEDDDYEEDGEADAELLEQSVNETSMIEMSEVLRQQQEEAERNERSVVGVWPTPVQHDLLELDNEPWPVQPAVVAATSETQSGGAGDGNSNSARPQSSTLKWVMEKQQLLVHIVTWNLQARPPPSAEEICRKLIPRDKFHIVVVGSEECENSIAKSAVVTSKKNWIALLATVLGPSYSILRAHTLQAIHSVVFAHTDILPLISDVRSSAVATGVGKRLGNKGGVGVAFRVHDTSIAVVSCHLAAHQNAVHRRNDHYRRINLNMARQLTEGGVDGVASPTATARGRDAKIAPEVGARTNPDAGSQNATSGAVAPSSARAEEERNPLAEDEPATAVLELKDVFDRVIWNGDFNYRVRGNRSMVDQLLIRNLHEVLLHNDQLSVAKHAGEIFTGYDEGPLHFRPTYKFDRNTDVYDSGPKQRIPAWTDRVLFKPDGLHLLAYDCEPELRTSDHRPVFASFICDVDLHKNADLTTEPATDEHYSQVCSVS